MGNVLSDKKKQQILALGRLGWPLRRIEMETGVRRETSSAYLRAAGIAVRPARGWGHAKPAKETIPDPLADSNPAKAAIPDSAWPGASRSPAANACEVRLLTWRSSANTWCELHEPRNLGVFVGAYAGHDSTVQQ